MEAPTSIEVARQTLLACGFILTIGTITSLLAQKIKVPDIAVFPIVCMVIGPEALGLITIKADSPLSQIILLFGASYILFEGESRPGQHHDPNLRIECLSFGMEYGDARTIERLIRSL